MTLALPGRKEKGKGGVAKCMVVSQFSSSGEEGEWISTSTLIQPLYTL